MPFVRIEPPGAPGQPEVQGLTNNTATLTWDKPVSDGGKGNAAECDLDSRSFFSGGPITGYWIEKREQNTDRWVPVNIAPCHSTQYTVPSLVEDRAYEFRVTGENEAGKGTPSEPSTLTKV